MYECTVLLDVLILLQVNFSHSFVLSLISLTSEETIVRIQNVQPYRSLPFPVPRGQCSVQRTSAVRPTPQRNVVRQAAGPALQLHHEPFHSRNVSHQYKTKLNSLTNV